MTHSADGGDGNEQGEVDKASQILKTYIIYSTC